MGKKKSIREKKKRNKREVYHVDPVEIEENIKKLQGGMKENKARYDFAIRLNDLLKEKDIDQNKFAEDIGIGVGTLSNYRKGIREPSLTVLEKMAKELKVSSDYLLGNIDLKSTESDYKNIYEIIGLTDDAVSVLKEYNTIYEGKVLIPVLNFLIAQEKLPPDEIQYEYMSDRADNTEWDEKKKEQWQNIVNEHYEKELKKWKDKNYIPIISMIEYLFNLKVKGQKIYMVDETIRKLFDDKKIEELFPEAIISNEDVADNMYLSRISEQLKKSKQKYKKRKESRTWKERRK